MCIVSIVTHVRRLPILVRERVKDKMLENGRVEEGMANDGWGLHCCVISGVIYMVSVHGVWVEVRRV